MNKIKPLFLNIASDYNLPFLLIFFFYTAVFLFLPIVGDDAALIPQYANLSLLDHWNLILYDFFEWSSRILVNFVIHFVLGKGKYVWILLNALVVTILCKTLSRLFTTGNDKTTNYFVVCLVMLFPIKHLGSAGWMVTYMTYLWPVTFGFVALLPIRYILDGIKMNKLQLFIYSISLIYAANEELELIVLLGVYSVFFVYLLYTKKISRYFLFQFILLLLSLIFTVFCPGNGARGDSEIINWFPNYNMLNIIDKIDLGFSTTMFELIYGNYIFLIVISVLMLIVILKKYNSLFYRTIGLIPTFFLIMLGPLKNITISLYPTFEYFVKAVSETGIFTITEYSIPTMIRFTLLCVIALCFIVSLFLCLEFSPEFLLGVSLLIFGMASRCAMAFSPTIFASGFRTATPLIMSFIAIGIMIITLIYKKKLLKSKGMNMLYLTMSVLLIISVINFSLEIY